MNIKKSKRSKRYSTDDKKKSVLLNEVLPYELPLFFNNYNFYDIADIILSKKSNSGTVANLV